MILKLVFHLGWAPLGRSGLGSSWLCSLMYLWSAGGLAGLPGLWWVWLGHSGDWDPHDAGVGSLTHSQGPKSKSKSTQSLRFWTSTTALSQRTSWGQLRVEKKTLLPDGRSYRVILPGHRCKEGKHGQCSSLPRWVRNLGQCVFGQCP